MMFITHHTWEITSSLSVTPPMLYSTVLHLIKCGMILIMWFEGSDSTKASITYLLSLWILVLVHHTSFLSYCLPVFMPTNIPIELPLMHMFTWCICLHAENQGWEWGYCESTSYSMCYIIVMRYYVLTNTIKIFWSMDVCLSVLLSCCFHGHVFWEI